MDFYLTYMGHVIDGPFDQDSAERAQESLIDEIFCGKVPGFLNGDDFESRADALDEIEVVAIDFHSENEMSFV